MGLFKKVTALVLAAAITIGSVTTVFAATGSPVKAPETNKTVKASSGAVVSTSKDGTATLKKNTKNFYKKKTVTVNTVKVKGVTYKVTAIAAYAFKNAKATKVIVGKNVKKISKNAFNGSKVKTIILRNRKVTIKKGAFKGLDTSKMTVKVNCTKKQLAKIKKVLKKAGFKGTVKIKKV